MARLVWLASLFTLVGAVTFVCAEAFLWPAATLLHLGGVVENATFVVSGLLGLSAGGWIVASALANAEH